LQRRKQKEEAERLAAYEAANPRKIAEEVTAEEVVAEEIIAEKADDAIVEKARKTVGVLSPTSTVASPPGLEHVSEAERLKNRESCKFTAVSNLTAEQALQNIKDVVPTRIQYKFQPNLDFAEAGPTSATGIQFTGVPDYNVLSRHQQPLEYASNKTKPYVPMKPRGNTRLRHRGGPLPDPFTGMKNASFPSMSSLKSLDPVGSSALSFPQEPVLPQQLADNGTTWRIPHDEQVEGQSESETEQESKAEDNAVLPASRANTDSAALHATGSIATASSTNTTLRLFASGGSEPTTVASDLRASADLRPDEEIDSLEPLKDNAMVVYRDTDVLIRSRFPKLVPAKSLVPEAIPLDVHCQTQVHVIRAADQFPLHVVSVEEDWDNQEEGNTLKEDIESPASNSCQDLSRSAPEPTMEPERVQETEEEVPTANIIETTEAARFAQPNEDTEELVMAPTDSGTDPVNEKTLPPPIESVKPFAVTGHEPSQSASKVDMDIEDVQEDKKEFTIADLAEATESERFAQPNEDTEVLAMVLGSRGDSTPETVNEDSVQPVVEHVDVSSESDAASSIARTRASSASSYSSIPPAEARLEATEVYDTYTALLNTHLSKNTSQLGLLACQPERTSGTLSSKDNEEASETLLTGSADRTPALIDDTVNTLATASTPKQQPLKPSFESIGHFFAVHRVGLRPLAFTSLIPGASKQFAPAGSLQQGVGVAQSKTSFFPFLRLSSEPPTKYIQPPDRPTQSQAAPTQAQLSASPRAQAPVQAQSSSDRDKSKLSEPRDIQTPVVKTLQSDCTITKSGESASSPISGKGEEEEEVGDTTDKILRASKLMIGTVSLLDFIQAVFSSGPDTPVTKQAIAAAILELSNQELELSDVKAAPVHDDIGAILGSKLLRKKVRIGTVTLGEYLAAVEFDEHGLAGLSAIWMAWKSCSEKDVTIYKRLGGLLAGVGDFLTEGVKLM
jgi:hypothetical protein